MQFHPSFNFEKLEMAFCKWYVTIQMDEHLYMAFKVIINGGNEKVEVLDLYII
jgi:hypothetical protein